MNIISLDYQPKEPASARPAAPDSRWSLGVLKKLPQTSNLVASGRVEKRQKSEGFKCQAELPAIERDVEVLCLGGGNYFVSKLIFHLYSEIVFYYPAMKFEIDPYQSEVFTYKHLYTEEFKEIKTIHDINPDIKKLYLSKQVKYSRFSLKSLRNRENFKSYQVIYFNKSISKPSIEQILSLKKDRKVLKSKRSSPVIPFISAKNSKNTSFFNEFLKGIENKQKDVIAKYKPAALGHYRNYSTKPTLKPTDSKQSLIKISPKLYNELMQVPSEIQFLRS